MNLLCQQIILIPFLLVVSTQQVLTITQQVGQPYQQVVEICHDLWDTLREMLTTRFLLLTYRQQVAKGR